MKIISPLLTTEIWLYDTFTSVNYCSWFKLLFHCNEYNQFENSRIYLCPWLLWAPQWTGKIVVCETDCEDGELCTRKAFFLTFDFLTRRWTGGQAGLSWADESHQGTPAFLKQPVHPWFFKQPGHLWLFKQPGHPWFFKQPEHPCLFKATKSIWGWPHPKKWDKWELIFKAMYKKSSEQTLLYLGNKLVDAIDCSSKGVGCIMLNTQGCSGLSHQQPAEGWELY